MLSPQRSRALGWGLRRNKRHPGMPSAGKTSSLVTARIRACRLAGRAIVAGMVAGIVAMGLFAGGARAQSPVTAAQAEEPGASSAIRVEGNRRIEASSIRTYFHAAPGGQLDDADLDTGLKALYATGLFADVRITRSPDGPIVTVAENPTLERVAFEGNRKLKDDQFKTEIQSKSGGPLWRPIVQADVARMVEIYHRRGYFQARVEPKIIEREKQLADLVFEVDEGAKTGVKKIQFVGNHAYSSDQLKGAITTGETNLLSFFLNNDIYDPDRIEVDRDHLRRFYLKHGYADVRIVAAAAQYDPGLKGIAVTFTVEEGSQYRIGAVELKSSLRDLDPAILQARLRPQAGDVYDADAVQQTVEALTLEAARHGHPFVEVQPSDDRDPSGHIVRLVYMVEPGQRRYIERIAIHGNSKTHDSVIRREFDIAEGDAYNRALIERAERRLKKLGFFKTVKITNAPGSAADRIVVNVEVEEQPTGDFSVMAGYSTTDGVIGEVSIGERNLLGRGDAVGASVTFGQYTKGFNLSFTEPHVADTGLTVGADLYGKQSIASSYQSYGSTTYGTTFRLGTALTDDLGVQWRYSLYNQSTSLSPALMDCSPSNPPPGCYANGEASLPVKQAALAGPAWVSAVGSTVNYNTLDNNRSPTSGINSALNQDLAGLGGDVNFLRTTEDFRAYNPIAGDVVGMVRGQGGYITPWGGQQLPLANGFFGGPQLVRGFAPNGFGPRDLTPGTTMDNVGGRQYWATSAELQAPVPLLPASSGLKVGVFADAGSVWGYRGGSTVGAGPALSQSLQQSVQVADSHAVRSSLGAGLIWDSPFGPLRADYAIPVSKTSYDVTQRFRFSAGGF
jgi:outer membrane protein insertion porin family